MIACCTLTKNDVVIGISHSGSSKDVVEALEFAKKSGATTICITNQGKSPITKNNVSDIKLFTSSTETKYKVVGLSSRLAQLTIVDALYAYISLKKGESAIENFEKVDEALSIKKY
jgi:DNA-binding MurR/RpiR family transcriptional regulator